MSQENMRMYDKYKIHVQCEKKIVNQVKLGDLPPTSCFRNMYDEVMMKLKPLSTISNIPCVYLTSSSNLGDIAQYTPEDLVVPIETRFTLLEKT